MHIKSRLIISITNREKNHALNPHRMEWGKVISSHKCLKVKCQELFEQLGGLKRGNPDPQTLGNKLSGWKRSPDRKDFEKVRGPGRWQPSSLSLGLTQPALLRPNLWPSVQPHAEESPGQLRSCSLTSLAAKITPSCSESARGHGAGPDPTLGSLEREGQPTQASIRCLKLPLPSPSVAAATRKEGTLRMLSHTCSVSTQEWQPRWQPFLGARAWQGQGHRAKKAHGKPPPLASPGDTEQLRSLPASAPGRDSWCDLGRITRNQAETKAAGSGVRLCQVGEAATWSLGRRGWGRKD